MILCVSLGSLKKAYKGSKKMSIGQKLGQKKSCKKDVITLLVKVIRPFANLKVIQNEIDGKIGNEGCNPSQ